MQLQLDRLKQLQHSNQLCLDDIAYKMTPVNRDHQNLEVKVKETENLLKQKDSLLQQLKQQYEQKMKNMQKQQENLKEIQVILQERPRLVEEIRSLKDTVRQLRQEQLSLPPVACSGNISSATNMRAEFSVSKIRGADHATHKLRKRMLHAVSEQIEEAEDSTSFRQQRIISQQRGTGNVKHEYVPNMSVNENHNNMKKGTYAEAAKGKFVLQSKKCRLFSITSALKILSTILFKIYQNDMLHPLPPLIVALILKLYLPQ
jgi:DNA repair exonuclease SbcCD ATPase subunit